MTTNGVIPARSAGVLLHASSLPGRHGIGDLGPVAHRWVDQLAAAGQTYWQVLPLGMPRGESPYQCYSAFAGNPLLIDLDELAELGLSTDVPNGTPPHRPTNLVIAASIKRPPLAMAAETFFTGRRSPLKSSFERFCHDQAFWLDDFALFLALDERFGSKPWDTWDRPLVRRDPAALSEARRSLAGDVNRIRFEQFMFDRQWRRLKKYANGKGIKIIGDVPIFVAGHSADVWTHPTQFLLDRDLRPKVVAGVPPDYFSATGQRWGNPLYDWKAMACDGFAWWTRRLKAMTEQCDVVRIDHFRGLAASWHVPAKSETAVDGKWVKSPGRELLSAVAENLGQLPFVAEDLGVITPDVERLRDDFALPGMRVLQFAFGSGPASPFLPHNYVPNAIAYTGTHDNDTTAGWYRSLLPKDRRHLLDYAPEATKDPAGALMRLASSSVARLSIVPAQDVLGLGSEARMNTPGVSDGNWRWRLTAGWDRPRPWERLAELTTMFGRFPVK